METYLPSIQIINKKIDVERLNTEYYNRKRFEIRREINEDTDIVLLNLIPSQEIEKRWIVELLLHLQKEFTDILIVPNTGVQDAELSEWINFFRPVQVLKQSTSNE